MRYLIIGIALLAMTCAFAAPVTDSDSGVVTLTIDPFIQVTLDSADVAQSITLSANQQTAFADFDFNYIANCAATVVPSFVEGTDTSNVAWSLAPASVAEVPATGTPVAGSNVTIRANAASTGGILLAGSSSATVTLTVTQK